MDLETLQSQMKVVIQKHQIVVTEMRKDPQNSVLQKQLNDLNSEIKSLSEKQKQIMQHLRSNLQKKQIPLTASSPNQPNSHSPNSFQIPQSPDLHIVCSTQKPMITNHRLTTPIQALSQKQMPNFASSLHQAVPPAVSNIVTSSGTVTFKGPMGTVVLPNCSNATSLLTTKSTDHQKLHPVLVVPTPTIRHVEGPQASVLVNLVPPIRVPQYPLTLRPPGTVSKMQNLSVPANHTLASVSCVSKMSSPATNMSFNSSHQPSASHHRSHHITHVVKIDPKKKEFMTALGLVSKDTLHDLKNKKHERKRRSTANPHFSNAALEEKWKNANALSQALAPPMKRPRGRPRLENKVAVGSTNGVCGLASEATDNSRNSPPVQNPGKLSATNPSTSSIVNGVHRQLSPAEEKKVEQLLSNLCIVCTQPGDLVKCNTCAKQQHLACIQPPLPTRPDGPWQCSDCTSRTDPLAAVHSYDVMKAAKEDEKRKLLKKSLDLRLKRSQLEGKLFQLKDLSSKQKDRQSELQLSLKEKERLMKLFENIVNGIRQFS